MDSHIILIVHDIKPNRFVKISRMLKYEYIVEGEVTIPLTQQPQGAGSELTIEPASQWDMVVTVSCRNINILSGLSYYVNYYIVHDIRP